MTYATHGLQCHGLVPVCRMWRRHGTPHDYCAPLHHEGRSTSFLSLTHDPSSNTWNLTLNYKLLCIMSLVRIIDGDDGSTHPALLGGFMLAWYVALKNPRRSGRNTGPPLTLYLTSTPPRQLTTEPTRP